MSNKNNNNKTILGLLIIAIAVLSYFMFSTPNHDPVELSEEVKNELFDESDEVNFEQQNPSQQSTNNNSKIDLEGLTSTPLDISLIGVVASNDESEASATIQSRLQIRTYFIDDQIAYTNAIILEIRNDRVILSNDGERQVLLLRGTASSDDTKHLDNRSPNQERGYDQHSSAEDIAKSIGNRPKLLEHIINISPIVQNNITAGFEVFPGMNPKLYKAAEFKAGDILQKINGNDITTEEGMEAVQQLIPTAQTLMFSVLRGGKVINLYLDIPSDNLSIRKY
ncbi:type II secretion system protein GspC [Aliiglaciecola lipolytica]|nr:type II secretion system protein GspC [Aliiglaciecola lipolytica]